MIAVFGSVNIDLVVEVEGIPRPGETVAGRSFARYPGGKGANQAIAASRLGADVAFYGKIGDDEHGTELLRALADERIDTAAVGVAELPSGVALITVAADGENAIASVPGANGSVDEGYVDSVIDRIGSADLLLIQLEIPLAAIARLLEGLPEDRPVVILDPSPVRDLSSLPLGRISIVTPNVYELAAISGKEGIEEGARALLEAGIENVICTAGEDGAYLFSNEESLHFPALPVTPVDTTAAGDAFNGALAWALEERALREALPPAGPAGSLATMRKGAAPSLPRLPELCAILDQGR